VTSPARSSETNITENVWHTIKLKLQSEIDMYKMRAEFTNAVCKFWRLLPIGYILTVYANIPHLLGLVIKGNFFLKMLTIRGKISSFSYTILWFLLLTSGAHFAHSRHVGD